MKVAQSRIADFLSMNEIPKEMLLRDRQDDTTKKDDGFVVTMEAVSVSWGTHAGTGEKKKKEDIEEKEETEEKEEKPTTPTTPPTPPTPTTPSGPTVVLENLNISIQRGECIAIVGPVGSGKSALCNSILREMEMISGEMNVKGTIAYAAQTAWILNASIRDNILFGKEYNKRRYAKVLKACQLTHDLEVLDDGDLTSRFYTLFLLKPLTTTAD